MFASCQLSKTINHIVYILSKEHIYIGGYDNSQLDQCPKRLFQVISPLLHVAAPCPAVLLCQTEMSEVGALHGTSLKPLYRTDKKFTNLISSKPRSTEKTREFGVAPFAQCCRKNINTIQHVNVVLRVHAASMLLWYFLVALQSHCPLEVKFKVQGGTSTAGKQRASVAGIGKCGK